MKIIILGWGSLIWDPRELPREGTWQLGGPRLKIEFSRISQDARLTLVIDDNQKKRVPTRYVLSPRATISDACHDLQHREGVQCKARIGFIDRKHNRMSSQEYPEHKTATAIIRTWLEKTKFDGVVWTALKSNFEKELGKKFSVPNAVEYVTTLPKNVRERAFHYIYCTPDEIDTPFRKVIQRDDDFIKYTRAKS